MCLQFVILSRLIREQYICYEVTTIRHKTILIYIKLVDEDIVGIKDYLGQQNYN